MSCRPRPRARFLRRGLSLALVCCMVLCGRDLPAAPGPVYSLADCLEMAARQNPEVLAAGKQVDAARGVVTQAATTTPATCA